MSNNVRGSFSVAPVITPTTVSADNPFLGFAKQLSILQDNPELPQFRPEIPATDPVTLKILGVFDKALDGFNLVEVVTPLNIAAIRAKWTDEALNGNLTNPQFVYDEPRLAALHGKLAQAVSELDFLHSDDNLRSENNSLEQLFSNADIKADLDDELIFARYRTLCQAASLTENISMYSHGKSCQEEAGKAVRGIYGMPSDEVIQAAYDFAAKLANGDGMIKSRPTVDPALTEQLKQLEFNAEQIGEVFTWALRQCSELRIISSSDKFVLSGFKTLAGTWSVQIDPNSMSIDVRDTSRLGRTIAIPANRHVDGVRLTELVAHEILSHCRCSENTGHYASRSMKPFDETFYEGAAMYLEYAVKQALTGQHPELPSPFYLIAMDLARQGKSFAEMAHALYPMVRPTKKTEKGTWNSIWQYCYRVLRGANSASNPKGYIFTKDRAYFEGALLVQALIATGQEAWLDYATFTPEDMQLIAERAKIYPGAAQFKNNLDSVLASLPEMLVHGFPNS